MSGKNFETVTDVTLVTGHCDGLKPLLCIRGDGCDPSLDITPGISFLLVGEERHFSHLSVKKLQIIMTKITIGSTIIGKSGKKLIVDRVEGDIIYSGEFMIRISAVVSVEPLSVIDRLSSLTLLDKREAIQELSSIASEFGVETVYEASLDLEIYLSVFIRRLLSGINSLEFVEIGKDGSEGKYGVLTFPDSPPPDNLPFNEIIVVGYRVTHIDPYHCYGADSGSIELIDSYGDCHVQWDSDYHIGRYSMDSLKSMIF